MQVFGLMVFTLIGMALVAGVSIALYASLPQSFLECVGAAPHGVPNQPLDAQMKFSIG